MKSHLRLFIYLTSLSLLISACGLLPGAPATTDEPAEGETQPAASTEIPLETQAAGGENETLAQPGTSSSGETVRDLTSLVSALQAAGAAAAVEGVIDPAFFPVQGAQVKVNGEGLQVFEFADEAAAVAEAGRISPDGGQIRETFVEWIAAPRFYRAGRIIVLYIGGEGDTIGLLQSLLGLPFAGAGSPAIQTTRQPGEPGETPETGTSGCAQPDARLASYGNTEAGYCLAFPVRFEVEAADPWNVFLNGPASGEGPEPVRATLNILVQEGVQGKSLAEVVDQATREYEDLPLSRTPGILGREPAVIVEGLPGRTGTRQVFSLHGGRLYHLIFGPFDPAFLEGEPDVQELWDRVMESFAFLDGKT